MITLSQPYITKSEYVYEEMKRKILTGIVMPGTRITLMQSAKEYKVSAIPIREALQRLQQDGLISIIPHVGAIVNDFNNELFCEIASVRNILEPYAAELATKNLTDSDLDELQLMINDMHKCVDKKDYIGYSDLNIKFHSFIYNCCGNSVLLDTINSLWEKSRMSKNVFIMDSNRMYSSLVEHEECFIYLKKRDSKAVGRLFSEHKRKGFAVVENSILSIIEKK